MRSYKFYLVVSLFCLLVAATNLTLSCIGDEPELLELQEPIAVPMVVEVDEWCEECRPVRKVINRNTVRRVVLKRPAVETFVQVTRERQVRRKPVRSLLRRLFSR